MYVIGLWEENPHTQWENMETSHKISPIGIWTNDLPLIHHAPSIDTMTRYFATITQFPLGWLLGPFCIINCPCSLVLFDKESAIVSLWLGWYLVFYLQNWKKEKKPWEQQQKHKSMPSTPNPICHSGSPAQPWIATAWTLFCKSIRP